MSASNALENAFMLLYFNATAWTGIAQNASSSPLTNLYVSLHTSDPGEAGSQNTNETNYTSYAREAVARDNTGWTVTNNSVSPASDIQFTQATGGSSTITHFGIGSDSSGAGTLHWSGTVTPNISVANGVTPILTDSTTITID